MSLKPMVRIALFLGVACLVACGGVPPEEPAAGVERQGIVDPNWSPDVCVPDTCSPWHSIECGHEGYWSGSGNPCDDDDMWQKKNCYDANCNIYQRERCYYWRSACHV